MVRFLMDDQYDRLDVEGTVQMAVRMNGCMNNPVPDPFVLWFLIVCDIMAINLYLCIVILQK